jgi:rSAM/selenodomain-associated transferase 2
MLSVIVPTLNEAGVIRKTLAPLQSLRGADIEIILVDGGSLDDTTSLTTRLVDKQLQMRRGRASQMNTGALAASGDLLLFLHADTLLSRTALQQLIRITRQSTPHWGRFNVYPDNPQWIYRTICILMNWRSRLTGIATGDQAIFIHRSLFTTVGGFPDIPLMEDIAISKRLKRHQQPLCLQEPVTISTRYWQKHGTVRSILRMWRLRLAYFLGIPPQQLLRQYYRPER